MFALDDLFIDIAVCNEMLEDHFFHFWATEYHQNPGKSSTI